MAPSRLYANHPDPMDLWLETQGYYRMLTARDGSCLFRAIAEQVYFTQKFHIEVRKHCVDYMKSHGELFEGHVVEGGVESYLEHMLSPTQWGGPLEITALSHLYRVDIVVFKEVGVAAEKVAETSYGTKVMLCFSHDRHYDSVYVKEVTKIAGFCQSLVYEMLYKNVFRMKDVDFAVEKMLHYKPQRHRGESSSCNSRKTFSYSCNSIQLQRRGVAVDGLLDDGEVNVRELLLKGVTPFPYKVAKSLDPNIFRNVEFDVWIDYRRGLRQGYFGNNDELRVGVKCIVKIEERMHTGHIQEMAPDKGPVVVFVEEFGEKRTVPYESLDLLPQESLALKHNVGTLSRPRSGSSLNLKSSSSENSLSNNVRKSRQNNELKGSNIVSQGLQLATGRKRNVSRSDHTSTNENGSESLNKISGVYQEANMMMDPSNFPVDGNFSSNGEYRPYQINQSEDLGMSLPIQTQALMPSQQLGSSPILIPVSPRPEDIPAHWLYSNNAANPSDQIQPTAGGEFPFLSNNQGESVDLFREVEGSFVTSKAADENANYVQGQINFNAPKSVLDDGADLPISDIQTLRYFYNLGNDVYRAQCNMQFSWGGYSQPCTVTSPSTPNPPGMCAGKCLCGPVCITTVPTIHHLLEPTTPPIRSRRKRQDSTGGIAGFTSESESPPTPPMSQPSSSTASTPVASVPPRFRNKGKNKKDAKVYEGQPIVHQPTLQIPSIDESIIGESPSAGSILLNSDHTSNLTVPFSPPYSYVYYPTSPVVPYSPVESDPYFTPLRLQFPTDYIPDTSQSPQCYPVNGDMSVYGTSAQYSMMATSPHYLVPASPGIYVGSPPAWSPITPATPQQQS